MNLSNASLASKLEATTDLEREVEMLLTAGGASEAGLAEKEMEELQAKVMYRSCVCCTAERGEVRRERGEEGVGISFRTVENH